MQNGLAGKKRCRMPIRANAHKLHIKKRPVWRKLFSTIKVFERTLIALSRIFRHATVRHGKNVTCRNGSLGKQQALHHAKIAVCMVMRHKPVITNKKLHVPPREALHIGTAGHEGIQVLRRGAATQGDAEGRTLLFSRLRFSSQSANPVISSSCVGKTCSAPVAVVCPGMVWSFFIIGGVPPRAPRRCMCGGCPCYNGAE